MIINYCSDTAQWGISARPLAAKVLPVLQHPAPPTARGRGQEEGGGAEGALGGPAQRSGAPSGDCRECSKRCAIYIYI